MSSKPMPESELQELLAQLARYFWANETRISADEVSRCLEHLPAMESSALDRMFSLIYMKKVRGSESGRKGQTNLPQWTQDSCAAMKTASRLRGVDSVGRMVYYQDEPPEESYEDRPSGYVQSLQPSYAPLSAYRDQQRSIDENQGISNLTPTQEYYIISSTSENAEQTDRGICSGQIAVSMPAELDTQSTPCSEFNEHRTSIQQFSSATDIVLTDTRIVSPRRDTATPLHFGTDDEAFNKNNLATCDDITFSFNTKRLLESCKTNLGRFLQAIREAKVSLPTGQGWEAAIATKKENVDIRDLMKIYHRFECHNIYKHVVEANFHPGTHWIREMRTTLANKLCQDFPERFQDQKAANKCLNWVDQGCKYEEWAGMFGEKTDLGYLIALPPNVSHSTYTSRCTKEQMNTTVLKFKSLGIDDMVKDMELTKLGDHIAATLRRMTGRKRRDIGEIVPRTWKSPQLTAGIPSARASQYGQNPTPPASLAADHIFGTAESSIPYSAQDQHNNHGQQGYNSSNVINNCAVTCDPFNVELNLSAYDQFMSSSPRFNDWYQHSNFMEEAAQIRLGPRLHQYTGSFQ